MIQKKVEDFQARSLRLFLDDVEEILGARVQVPILLLQPMLT